LQGLQLSAITLLGTQGILASNLTGRTSILAGEGRAISITTAERTIPYLEAVDAGFLTCCWTYIRPQCGTVSFPHRTSIELLTSQISSIPTSSSCCQSTIQRGIKAYSPGKIRQIRLLVSIWIFCADWSSGLPATRSR